MPLQFLRRLSISKNAQSLDVVAQRFCQIFQDHGVKKPQIPRLMSQITLADLKSNETLLAVLTPEILDQTARLFGIRIEWLEGVDDEIYPYRHCYKEPGLLLDLLATLKSRADSDWPHFPLRVLVSSRHLDCRADQEQILVPVVLEKIAELGSEPVYRYYVFNDEFDWAHEPARIQLKAMARLVYKGLRAQIPLLVIPPAELQSVLNRKRISHEFFDGCLLTSPSLEDFALTNQESQVAVEVDEMPMVFKYIEDHKLEGFFANVPRDTSPPQGPPPETQQLPEPSTPPRIPPKTGKRASNDQQLWEPVRAVAGALWAEHDSLPIADAIRRIKKMAHLKASALGESAIRKHIADLAPASIRGKPGRKPNQSS